VRAGGRTDTTKTADVSRNFANAPKTLVGQKFPKFR